MWRGECDVIEEIANLPEISFIDNMTLDDVQQQMVSDYKERYKQLTGKEATLKRADPIALILYACSVQIYQSALFVDRDGKYDLLKYSRGGFLDNLAALKGITREPAKAAVAKVRFTLSAVRDFVVGIPAGTRVTNGDLYYATGDYAEIPPGEQSIDLTCTCQTAGKSGNGLMAGDINVLVDPIAYVKSVTNIEETTGGTDVEDDESLVERVYIAPSKYSVAGPEDAYKYWAKTFNQSIMDVYVGSDKPVDVLVEFIMDNGELPSQSMVESLQEYLQDGNIRPLTDRVTVKAPDTVEYAINAKYFINKSDQAKAATIQTAVNAAIQNYIIWQRSKIGRDINPSKLTCMIQDAGAKRIEITEPVFRRINKADVAKLSAMHFTYGGIEDD